MREDGIRRRIDEAKRRVVSAGSDDVKLRTLESLAKSKRAELERVQSQLEAARTTSDARAVPVEVQIVSRARPSSEKAWPRVGMMSLLAVTATLLLGLAFVVTRELFGMARPPLAERAAAHRPALAGNPGPAANASPLVTARSVAQVARQLIAKANGRTGFRTVVAGEGASAGPTGIELARELARQGQPVILLDWSLDGTGLAPELGVSPTLGIVDVLAGRASFEDVIERMAGSQAHVIAAGSSAAGTAAARDKDRVDMLLDALDEAYAHVVITGSWEGLRELFITTEGRVDAGVTVAGGGEPPAAGDFLGFTVANLDIIRYEPSAPARSAANLVAVGGSPG
jgi:hypothetical protein